MEWKWAESGQEQKRKIFLDRPPPHPMHAYGRGAQNVARSSIWRPLLPSGYMTQSTMYAAYYVFPIAPIHVYVKQHNMSGQDKHVYWFYPD